jgi:aspartyl protease family protein
MLGWALRTVTILGVVSTAIYVVGETQPALFAPAGSDAAANAAKPQAVPAAVNSLSYRADRNGHVFLEAAVNGSTVRFLVDTGASMVALTQEDARAAGIGASELRFIGRVATANGEARVAPVKLREVRLGQLTVEDVDAVVVDAPLHVSLLGMSFLKRVEAYEMRDGKLIISW